jgi:hypothetical protein
VLPHLLLHRHQLLQLPATLVRRVEELHLWLPWWRWRHRLGSKHMPIGRSDGEVPCARATLPPKAWRLCCGAATYAAASALAASTSPPTSSRGAGRTPGCTRTAASGTSPPRLETRRRSIRRHLSRDANAMRHETIEEPS